MGYVGGKNKHIYGFTIVELLIVIVVIGILAAITIVAFNGIQQRSKNTQTVNAITSYVKLLNLYKVDHGTHPEVYDVCLGEGYPGGECRAGWDEDGDGINSVYLADYLRGQPPTPDMTRMQYNGTTILSGAWYTYASGSYNPTGAGIGVMLLGSANCPTITGTTYINTTATADGQGRLCRYAIN